MTAHEIITKCAEHGVQLSPVLDISGDIPPELAAELQSQSEAVILRLLLPGVRLRHSPDGIRPVSAYDRHMKGTQIHAGFSLPWDCVIWHHEGEAFYRPGPANVMGWTSDGE